MKKQSIAAPKNLIARLGVEALPDDEKIELVERVAGTIEKSVFLRVFDLLSEDDQDVLAEALLAGNMTTVESVIEENNIPFDTIISEETEKIVSKLESSVTEQ